MNCRTWMVAALLLAALGCSKQEAKQTASNVVEKVDEAIDIAAPFGGKDDPEAREQERFDETWRDLEVFRAVQAARRAAEAAEVDVIFAPNGKESLKDLTPDAIVKAPVVIPLKGDMSGPSVLKTQVYLDRLSFSVGVIDGRWGRNAAIALWWYQRSRGIEAAEPGAVDEATFRSLASSVNGVPALVQYTLTEDDVKGPFVSVPEGMYEKAELDCLCYESKKEKVAERFHTTTELLDQLNPDVELQAGQSIWVPNVREPLTQDRPDIARVVISIRGNTFNAFDAAGNLIFHAPTTLGSKYDPSPKDTAHVKKIVHDPHFHYQPKLFAEVPDTEPEANLNPGPNSPVGVVWIALSKPHFGIHGTSDPDSIGYASSHGCVRLTNWDATEVAHRISENVQVEFLDTRSTASSVPSPRARGEGQGEGPYNSRRTALSLRPLRSQITRTIAPINASPAATAFLRASSFRI
ncbi:MAG TPA: L,D-transpeptidase [Thermoanaerobaculia bacterium]|nr:L,D-transpeptidase [Thermoanaerobaculia bacterium]